MENYTVSQLMRLAKRHHNTKRTYLLVDPLQGKHIPVSPSESLEMLRTLGRRYAETAPETDLVIGFAETATAVGAAVASMLPGCRYIHTTREPAALTGGRIEFREEHSHAAEQYLCTDLLGEWLKDARSIAFVDDELSTGKTLLNMIAEIRRSFPEIAGKDIRTVSIINLLTDERIAALGAEGVRCVSLLRLPMNDLTAEVEKYAIAAPENASAAEPDRIPILTGPVTEDPRSGCLIADFLEQCNRMNGTVRGQLAGHTEGRRITVLGTEEWMLPGLLLGEYIEKYGKAASVRFHATTRSPIGICTDPEYPIRSGVRLHSFYEENRETYLYDLQECDTVIILTDSPDSTAVRKAYEDLCGVYAALGCNDIILIREDAHVRYLSK